MAIATPRFQTRSGPFGFAAVGFGLFLLLPKQIIGRPGTILRKDLTNGEILKSPAPAMESFGFLCRCTGYPNESETDKQHEENCDFYLRRGLAGYERLCQGRGQGIGILWNRSIRYSQGLQRYDQGRYR
jgi:hypothetical protein